MENQAFELEVIEEGRVKRNGSVFIDKTEEPEPETQLAVGEVRMADEMAQYEEVKGVAETGNGLRLDALLGEWQEKGWLRDWRNEENLTLYAEAVTDSFLDVINVLLKYDIPLGDALIRAIDVEFEDAIKTICQYLSTREDICEEVLVYHCDNDDFHPALTPLVLAAQRNNYDTVMLLLDLGAEISEPSISLGGDVTLTQAITTLHIYRALSQPAFILATQTDVFGYAFAMTAKLQSLSKAWTDFGAELEQLAQRIEVFAGEMLGKSASSGEILALFGYHNTDKYRDKAGRQHPLSKMFEAICYQQKEFIAHPHSQKVIIGQFYRDLQSWNDQGFFHQILLMLLVMVGYPVICLAYIFFPVRKVVKFVRNPYVKFLMNTGSGFTFLILIFALTVTDKIDSHRQAAALYAMLLIWTLGLMWRHMKTLMMHGLKEYLLNSIHIVESIIIAVYVTVFFLQWNGQINIISNVQPRRRRAAGHDTINYGNFTELQDHVSTVLSGFQDRLNASLAQGLEGLVTGVLSQCQPVAGFIGAQGDGEGGSPLTSEQQILVNYDQFEPVVVAQALFAFTIVMASIRLMNLLLVSDTVGPLRISLGAMVGDILKFCAIFVVIWFAFAIGLFINYYSASEAATRACYEGGGESYECEYATGFSTFIDAIAKLYWSLFGMIELDVLMLNSPYSVAEVVGTALFIVYHIAAVLVLLNALIGMLSNTYNLTEEHADTEWKFHRAAVWASYLRPVGTLPPPFNLIPSVKSIFRLCRYIVGIWLKCARRKQINQKQKYSKEELAGYMRALKLTRDRYIQDHLSSTSTNSEVVRPRDIQSLRNDITSFRFFAQDRLEALNKNLNLSNEKSSALRQKLEDLDPLKILNIDVVQEASELTENIDELSEEVDGLKEEQETEISDRDKEAADLRADIAALQAQIEQLVTSHSSELAKRDRQEAHLNDVIKGLEQDKSGQNDKLSQLRIEKADLIDTVGKVLEQMEILQQQVNRLQLQIPKPTPEKKPVPEEPEQQMRPGLLRRIKNVVEKTMTDIGEGLTTSVRIENNATGESERSQTGSNEQLAPSRDAEEEHEPETQDETRDESAMAPETPKADFEIQKESSEQQMTSPLEQVDFEINQTPLQPEDVKSPRSQEEVVQDPPLDIKMQTEWPEQEPEEEPSTVTEPTATVEAPASLPNSDVEPSHPDATREGLDLAVDGVGDDVQEAEPEVQSPELSSEQTADGGEEEILETDEMPMDSEDQPEEADIPPSSDTTSDPVPALGDQDVAVDLVTPEMKSKPEHEQDLDETDGTEELDQEPYEEPKPEPEIIPSAEAGTSTDPDIPPTQVQELEDQALLLQESETDSDPETPVKETLPDGSVEDVGSSVEDTDLPSSPELQSSADDADQSVDQDAPTDREEEPQQPVKSDEEPELDTSLKTPEKDSEPVEPRIGAESPFEDIELPVEDFGAVGEPK